MAIIVVTVIKYNTLSVGIQRFSQHISDDTGDKIAHCDTFKTDEIIGKSHFYCVQ